MFSPVCQEWRGSPDMMQKCGCLEDKVGHVLSTPTWEHVCSLSWSHCGAHSKHMDDETHHLHAVSKLPGPHGSPSWRKKA